jgi:cytochrome c oxidase subunit 2
MLSYVCTSYKIGIMITLYRFCFFVSFYSTVITRYLSFFRLHIRSEWIGHGRTIPAKKVGFNCEMIRWQHVGRLLPIMVLALVLTGCGDPKLSALLPRGPVGEEQLSLIYLSSAIMVLVFVVVMVIFTYVLVRFRHRPGQDDEIPEQVEGNHKLEITWTVIPILLLLVLAVPTVMATFSEAENYSEREGTVNVKVVANQYWWEFQYPDLGIVTSQELYIPKGEWIQFEVTSKDVLHSFWIPVLGGKVDTNPGLINHLRLKADEAGTYYGRCAELCGPAHALMSFKAVALEPEEFEQWVTQMQAYNGGEQETQPEAETELVAQGREIFNAQAQSCISCHAVDSSLETAANRIGPNLAGFGSRETLVGILEKNDEDLERWIRYPDKVKPGSKMPGFDRLSDQEMTALIEYLNSLTLE